MRWILLAFVALLLWVAVRWMLRATGGVTQARDRAFAALRAAVPGVGEIEREPGLVVLSSADDRVELDYAAVLKIALAHKSGGAALEAELAVLVEDACEAQTDPEQLGEEREEAAAVLGDDAPRLTDGLLLRVLFGHDAEEARDAALHAALAALATPGGAPADTSESA